MPTLNTFPKAKPRLAIVSGRPGSGKTTLARTVAQTLYWPLISRDDINEGIGHTFAQHAALADKDHVAKAAFDAFFGAIGLLLSSGVALVVEAAFQDQRWRIGLEPLIPLTDMRIVHCTLDAELAYQRVVRRRLEQADPRPPTVRPFEPLSLPMPALQVATGDGYEPGLDEIVAFIASR